jgi:hypothetical protein
MATGMKNYGKNIYTAPNGLVRKTVVHGNTRLVKELFAHAQTVCRNQISEQYIADVLNPDKKNFSNGYAYFLNDELVGFVVWTVKNMDTIKPERPRMSKDTTPKGPTKILNIDLLCAKETGTTLGYTMLYDVETYCIDKAIPIIDLYASDIRLEPYYEQFGFMAIRPTPVFDEVHMTKPVTQLLLDTPINYKRGKTRRKGQVNKVTERDKKAIQFLVENGPKMAKNIEYIRNVLKLN